MRTLLGKTNTREVNSYVEKIVDPLWTSMQAEGREQQTAEPAQQRIDEACRRIEKAANRLEKAAKEHIP